MAGSRWPRPGEQLEDPPRQFGNLRKKDYMDFVKRKLGEWYLAAQQGVLSQGPVRREEDGPEEPAPPGRLLPGRARPAAARRERRMLRAPRILGFRWINKSTHPKPPAAQGGASRDRNGKP